MNPKDFFQKGSLTSIIYKVEIHPNVNI